MADVIDWRQSPDVGAALEQMVRALQAGGVVALPTDTSYGLAANATSPEAVDTLLALSPEPATLVLAVRDANDALAWVPEMSPLAQRLARRCWPGPLEMALAATSEPINRLNEALRHRLVSDGLVTLRAPGHEAFLETLDRLRDPIVFISTEATAADQLTGEALTLIVDGGPCRYPRPASRLRIDGNSWTLVLEGIVSREQLDLLSGCLILFVCTGNTCRSPLAEALCKKLLAERLGCGAEELPQRGYLVQSAGLAAMHGGTATEEAVVIAQELGADLSSHASRPISVDLLFQADHIVAMTRGHMLLLVDQFPWLSDKTRLLCPDGSDVPDPIGAAQDVYRACGAQILRHLERLVPEVQA